MNDMIPLAKPKPSSPPAQLLSVKELTTAFFTQSGRKPVLNAISFAVSAGETVAVVGESGSGKSVTALSIMRLLSRETGIIEGSIRFAEQDLLRLPERELRRIRGNQIAMIFQEPMTSLNPLLTIGWQVAEPLLVHQRMSRKEARAEAIRLPVFGPPSYICGYYYS